MKKRKNIYRQIPPVYLILLCCALALLVFLDITQKNQIIRTRMNQGFQIVKLANETEIQDENTPVGYKKEYILEAGNISESENCLAFYVVHHYVQVYIDNELVYSLTPGTDRTISKTTGCKWAMIPLSPKDSGKEIKVILTPAYKSVAQRDPEFIIGARHSIMIYTVKNDICDVTLSVLAAGTGIVFIVISLFWLFQKKSGNSLLYLGVFSTALGVWKLTDTRTIAMIFPEHALVLSQISLVMLSMAVVPLILFIKKQIERKNGKLLDITCIISIVVTSAQLLLQATGKVDLRESLQFTHGMIVLTTIAVISTVPAQLRSGKNKRQFKITCACFLLFTAGALLDLIRYYLTGESGDVLNTLAVFLLYILVMGVMSIMDLTHQATLDYSTGLFNRSYCSEKVRDDSIIQKETCLIMFDLNQLKKINDTFGHESGDEIIAHFAEILRQNIPASAFLGRYGGDEFIAILESCDKKMADQILSDIAEDTEKYNTSDCKAELSFSAGYALSAEYPECTMLTLMKKADEKMYENKKLFYKKLNKQ